MENVNPRHLVFPQDGGDFLTIYITFILLIGGNSKDKKCYYSWVVPRLAHSKCVNNNRIFQYPRITRNNGNNTMCSIL